MSSPVTEPRVARVVLYGRPDCKLCDEARAAVLALRDQGFRFELRERNIEDDEGLLRTHADRIPVIEVDGTEVSELDVDAVALRAALET